MAVWQIYDHIDARGHNVIEDWLDSLNPKARAKVHAKFIALRQYGGTLPTTMLSDTDVPRIKKLRSRGRINWRILVCKGPINEGSEFTAIDAVQEKDNEMPAGSTARAARMRLEIEASPQIRRKAHDFEKYKAKQ